MSNQVSTDDDWLAPLRDVLRKYADEISALKASEARAWKQVGEMEDTIYELQQLTKRKAE